MLRVSTELGGCRFYNKRFKIQSDAEPGPCVCFLIWILYLPFANWVLRLRYIIRKLVLLHQYSSDWAVLFVTQMPFNLVFKMNKIAKVVMYHLDKASEDKGLASCVPCQKSHN